MNLLAACDALLFLTFPEFPLIASIGTGLCESAAVKTYPAQINTTPTRINPAETKRMRPKDSFRKRFRSAPRSKG